MTYSVRRCCGFFTSSLKSCMKAFLAFWEFIMSTFKILFEDFPGHLEVKNQLANRFDSWPRKIPHATGQLSPCTTTEPTFLKALVAQSCQSLCDSMDCSPTGSSVHGILQARILEWVAIPFSRGSSRPKDQTQVSCTEGRFFAVWATRKFNKRSHCNEKPVQ